MTVIPRKLWLFWQQGVSEAPYVVKKCVDSWVRENPTWDIVILDSQNIGHYIDLDMPEEIFGKLLLAHQSDLIRLLLLSTYGGVWADVTTFCTKPLDTWIDDYASSGFFVFRKPGKDRIMSNWFIASQKDSPVCTKLYRRLRRYWIENDFGRANRIQRKATAMFTKYFNRSEQTTKYWFSPVVTKIFKVYPYFAFHYMFERLVASDNECKAIWTKTKIASADPPHLLYFSGLASPLTETIKKQIDDKDIPLFKLTYKYDHSRYAEGTVLHYLLEESG